MSPIAEPKLPAEGSTPLLQDKKSKKSEEAATKAEDVDGSADASMKESSSESEEEDDEGDEEKRLEARRHAELERLHRLGIPVPGVTIKVDKLIATVWLEHLEIECPNKLLADRVRAVVDRAVEVTAPLWG